MVRKGIKVNMTPAHPGLFVRYDVLEEFNLSVTDAAEILGVCPETLANLVDCKIRLSPDLALRLEKGFCPQYGLAATDTGVARCGTDARPVG